MDDLFAGGVLPPLSTPTGQQADVFRADGLKLEELVAPELGQDEWDFDSILDDFGKEDDQLMDALGSSSFDGSEGAELSTGAGAALGGSARGTGAASSRPRPRSRQAVEPAGAKRGPRPRRFRKNTCQADGCTTDLGQLSFYYQRNHICPDHLKCESYSVKGVPSRFCQRCGQGHNQTEFGGKLRSCTKSLEKHNKRRRGKQLMTDAPGAAAPVAATADEASAATAAAGPSQQSSAPRQQLLPGPASPDMQSTGSGGLPVGMQLFTLPGMSGAQQHVAFALSQALQLQHMGAQMGGQQLVLLPVSQLQALGGAGAGPLMLALQQHAELQSSIPALLAAQAAHAAAASGGAVEAAPYAAPSPVRSPLR